MSKGELLYFKGMKMPESEEESDNEDIWDDSKLTAAYDKAVSMANAEIAKRVAMSTNNRSKAESQQETQTTKAHKKGKSSKHHSGHAHGESAMKWKAGMACSAVYDCDGLEYEAFILRIINDDECVVRFLGYENSEIVAISSLKPSLGKEARAKQIQVALDFNTEEVELANVDTEAETPVASKISSMYAPKNETMDIESDRIQSEVSSGSHRRKKKSSKKKKQNRNSCEMPRDVNMGGFPMPMPNLADFMNSGIPEMPIPPPPVSVLAGASPGRQQALSSMLLSWYMSGYCTGYYQGITRSKESIEKN